MCRASKCVYSDICVQRWLVVVYFSVCELRCELLAVPSNLEFLITKVFGYMQGRKPNCSTG